MPHDPATAHKVRESPKFMDTASVTDDLGREAVAGVARRGGRRHSVRLREPVCPGKPDGGQVDGAMIGAMAELESSLISERVTAGMRAAEARGKHLGRPAIPKRVVSEIEALATSTDLSVRQIQAKIAGRASRGIVGQITKRARAPSSPSS